MAEFKFYNDGAQLTLFEMPEKVKKTRSAVVDEIMSHELTQQVAVFSSEDKHDVSDLPIRTKVMLSYEGVELEGKNELTAFDREVIEAVATLSLNNEYVSSSTIYRVITGKTKSQYVGPKQRERVIQSMEKCACSRLRINISPDSLNRSKEQGLDITEATFSSNLISFESIVANSSMGPVDCYKILAVPALFRYAVSIGKVSEFPIGMLDSPPAKTEHIILTQAYLLRRIDAMNRRETEDFCIEWHDIFNATGRESASRQQLQKIRGYVCEILDFWKKKYRFIKDYRASNKARGKITIEPNFDFPTSTMQSELTFFKE